MVFQSWDFSLWEAISRCLLADKVEFSDVTPGYFGTVYVATDKDKEDLSFAETCGCGIYRGKLEGEAIFSFPFGGGDKPAALRALAEHCREASWDLRFYPVGEAEIALLRETLGGEWKVTEIPGAADYIYDPKRLVSLEGLPEARRAIRKFEACGPWNARDAVPADIPAMMEVLEMWTAVRGGANRADHDICRDAVLRVAQDGTLATVVEQNGRLVSFEIGRWLNPDMVVAEFEKNDPKVPGGCQIANREFARRWVETAAFVNRTCDLGEPGLALAKRLYRPCRMVRKWCVEKMT